MANFAPVPANLYTPAQEGILNDDAQKDSANEMWDMYLDEVKEDDKRIADAWKDDSNGILVFTGLFSATVGAFIIEFYKTLSPDSSGTTVALLQQISHQLADSPNLNGTYSNIANQPFSPKASMIWVNAMWLISLVLSLTSALIATLLQQWARRYAEKPHVPSDPNERARVRSFLFTGTKVYRMRHAVKIAPGLLHLSVYLFFAGLVILFHTINKTVAIAVYFAVGVFGAVYLVMSILPCLDVKCPYRTPMSHILWVPWHLILYVAALFLYWFVERLHEGLVRPGLDNPLTDGQHRLVDWLESLENAVKSHCRYLKEGLRDSVISRAISVQDADRKMVTRLFNLLARSDKSKLRTFAARIPRNRIQELIPLIIESQGIVLRESLVILLRSCTASTHLAGPDEEVRKRSLLVCLDAIHHITKAPHIPDLSFVRTNFADTNLMQALQDDGDPDVQFTSRSICALVARQVVREPRLEEPQLRWLHNVTGETSSAIFNANEIRRDRMNLKSFVYRVLSNQVDDLPTEVAASFKETLAILLNARTDGHFDTNFDAIDSQNRLSMEVGQIQREDPQGSREVVGKLRSMFLFLPAYPPHHPHAPAAP